MVPDLADVPVDVGLAGGDHLVGDLDEERGHALWGVVVARDAVDHPDGIHQAWDVLNHGTLKKGRMHGMFDC